jgi:hypothetical protein
LPPKAGSLAKKIPGRIRIVQVRKSALTSGIAAAVSGTILYGRASGS